MIMKITKIKLFELYASNFNVVRNQIKFTSIIPNDDLFICPMCFQYFTRQETARKNSLVTVEDVPPRSLGGKPITLTCVGCNRWAGRELESHLNHVFDLIEFHNAIPGASLEGKIEYPNIGNINAHLSFMPNRHLKSEISESRSNPSAILKLLATKGDNPELITIKSSGKRGRPIKYGRAECAILRIAYLIGFSQFGYSYIYSSPISLVRSQILNPDDLILSNWGIIPANNLSDDSLGVNLVTHPKILKSFGIVFDLITKLRKYRYLVLLPGPSYGSENIYDALESGKFSNGLHLKASPLPYNKVFLSDPKYAFVSDLWDRI